MKNKKISVTIPSWFMKNHNGRYSNFETFYIAAECLNRFMEVTPRDLYELIIVDNGSDLNDDDIKEAKNIRFKPSWYWDQADILIKNKFNLGYGPACNQAIAVATGEYILNINNDILCWSGFVEELLATFEQKLTPKIGMAMPAIDKSGIRFPEILNIKKEDVDMKTNAGKYGNHAQFGSAWLMKRELLEELYRKDGFYFDPQFKFLFKEDRDLYQRVYELGYETWRTHYTRCHHVGNLSVSKHKNKNEISLKNRELYEKKWGGKEK